MEEYIKEINDFWEIRDSLTIRSDNYKEAKKLIDNILNSLEKGKLHVCSKQGKKWVINQWIKKAILLNFKLSENQVYKGGVSRWYDKVSLQFNENNEEELKKANIRLVPGAYIREGSYIGKNSVIMPSFINIGAYVGEKSLIDSWATVGSCAYIGNNCHISGGVGIGGVLEPLQASPVIIEDNCFIGARSEIVEGVIVEEGSVISMGVFIGASTKIVNRNTGEIIYGKVPAYSVVVPGCLPDNDKSKPFLSCAVIIKQVDKKTREKTAINDLLRG